MPPDEPDAVSDDPREQHLIEICRLALDPTNSLGVILANSQFVIGLTRVLRLRRTREGLPRPFVPAAVALVDAVRENIVRLSRQPDPPRGMAARLRYLNEGLAVAAATVHRLAPVAPMPIAPMPVVPVAKSAGLANFGPPPGLEYRRTHEATISKCVH